MHRVISIANGGRWYKSNLYYFLPYLVTHVKAFFISYKTVPKGLRQSLDYSFRKPIFYFSMPCNRLAYAGLRIPIPIMFTTMANKDATV